MNRIDEIYAHLAQRLDAFRRDQRGLSTVEYIIILILIAVVAIALWQTFGQAVQFRIRQGISAVNSM